MGWRDLRRYGVWPNPEGPSLRYPLSDDWPIIQA